MTRKPLFAMMLLATTAWPSLAIAEAPADAAPAAATDAPAADDIVVIGRGETRQVQEISTRDFDLVVACAPAR